MHSPPPTAGAGLPLLLALLLLMGAAATAAGGEAEVVRLYDLTDVIEPVQDFPSPLLLLREDQRSVPAARAKPGDGERRDEFLHRLFEPSMAELIGRHSELRGATLFVTGNSALHGHVEGELARFRRQQQLMVKTDVIVILMDPKERQERYALRDLAWRDLPGSPGQAVADLDRAHGALLAAQINAKEADLIVLSHPSVTSFSAHPANASQLMDYRFPRLQFTAAGPALGSGSEALGDSIAVCATATEDRRFIHLVLDHLRVALLSVSAIDLGVGPDGRAAVAQEPVLWRTREHIDQAIPNGQAIIVSTGAYLEKDHAPRAGFLVISCGISEPAKDEQLARDLADKRMAAEQAAKAAAVKAPADGQGQPPKARAKGANDF